MQEIINALVAVPVWIWNAFNAFLIWLFDGALYLWPSTPEALLVSHQVQALQVALPGAPWWLLGDLAIAFPAIMGPVLLYKIVNLIWP